MKPLAPKASLIISVYDNAEYLKAVLDSLILQTFTNFEVIVSEDAQHQHIKDLISSYKSPYPLYHLSQEDLGWRKNLALNRATQFAHTDYLIFIDGDCLLHPRFIEFHIKLSAPNTIVAGKRIKLDAESSKWILSEKENLLKFQSYLFNNYLKMRRNGAKFMEEGFFFDPKSVLGFIPKLRKMNHLKGCNMSFHKCALHSINGFDEDYTRPAVGEDADLAWRFQGLGYRMVSARNLAVQYHLYHKESWQNQDENLRMMMEKHTQNLYVCKNGIKKL
jgi:glycosyltransferase involved in cell wall biosynthesis